jgi:F-type H+-transporting ATPase subunit epsilon
VKTRLHLIITTPTAVLVDDKAVRSVRATDSSGCFGILPKHTDLITVLVDSVVRWHDISKTLHYCAVRRGVLMVGLGATVSIACREGLTGDNLELLQTQVRESRAQETDADREETIRQMRLQTQAMRQIMGYLRPASWNLTGQDNPTINEHLRP